MGDVRIGVAAADHFALFGDLDATAHRFGRLGQDGAIGRSAAAPDGAAAPVEERQPHAVFVADFGQRALGLEEHPVGAQIAAVFVGIAVADHDLLLVDRAGRRWRR